jgi:hypothetical protein
MKPMKPMKLARTLQAFALCLVLPAVAHAAPVPISSLPLGSDTIVPAKGTVRVDDVRHAKEVLITAIDKPVCIRSDQAETGDGFAWFDAAAEDKLVVERLVEGAEPVLERTMIDPRSPSLSAATLLGRGSVSLVSIDTGSELGVYAYRTATAVHILARRGFNLPVEAFDFGFRMSGRAGCGFIHLVFREKEGSASVRLVAPHPTPRARWVADFDDLSKYDEAKLPPGDAPTFVLNASLSKVSRDPEPIVSVSVRATPPPPAP